MVTIYDNVSRIAKERKLPIMEVEKRAGLGNATISGWKTANPRINNLKAVADCLGVPIESLLDATSAESL